jgi:hypothetical protein
MHDTKIKKTVFTDEGVWEDRHFYGINLGNNSKTLNALTDFLKKNYGTPKYVSTWWTTHYMVFMSEKIYLHWSLYE